jgi:hypothetical protein
MPDLTVRPWTDSWVNIHAMLGTQLDKVSETSIPIPIKLPFHFLMM